MFCTSAQRNLQGKGYKFIKQGSALEYMLNQTCTSNYSHFLPMSWKEVFLYHNTHFNRQQHVKIAVFWLVTPCSLVQQHQPFRIIYCLNFVWW